MNKGGQKLWIYLKSKSNLFNWTWIRYNLDTFLDYPNCILGWILTWPDPGWAKTIRAQVEQSRPKSTSSWVADIESTRVDGDWYWAELAHAIV